MYNRTTTYNIPYLFLHFFSISSALCRAEDGQPAMEFSLARGARHNVLQITDSRRGLTIGLELKTCVVESCSAWAKSLRALEAELGAFLRVGNNY